jgi:dTDP-4-dehydrorhamnose reductase
MRVLIPGGSGQLGLDLQAVLSASGDEVVAAGHAQLDITDRDSVMAAVTSIAPDVVINCAAWTAVDACESDPQRSFGANALGVRWLAEACDRVGAHLVQISTDYVFDGTLDRPYHEWDALNPQSVYGASKAAGEREALALGVGAAVVRTSWVCGVNGANMVKTVMRLAREHPQLSFVDDQVGHPTFTADLAVALRRIAVDRRSGVHHLTNQGETSWFGFAQQVVAAMGLDPAIVAPIATSALQPARPAVRPANSRLDNAVWRGAGLPALRDYREPLSEVVKALMV